MAGGSVGIRARAWHHAACVEIGHDAEAGSPAWNETVVLQFTVDRDGEAMDIRPLEGGLCLWVLKTPSAFPLLNLPLFGC